jgi:hypothetical protein
MCITFGGRRSGGSLTAAVFFPGVNNDAAITSSPMKSKDKGRRRREEGIDVGTKQADDDVGAGYSVQH